MRKATGQTRGRAIQGIFAFMKPAMMSSWCGSSLSGLEQHSSSAAGL